MSKEKKYRFYYSKKQDAVDEDMWGFAPRYTFVKTPDGYKQYSELCSIKGTRCNWSDSELVYEADEMPEIIVHEAIPELIADLEAKLAESESRVVELSDGIRKLEEVKDSKIKGVRDFWMKRYEKQLKQQYKEINQLKQQLAEKEKDVQKWKNKKVKYIVDNIICDRNQTAIDELEKVIEFAKTQDEFGFRKSGMEIFMFVDQQINNLRSK